MKRYLYMNEHIREPVPSAPVIVVQSGEKLRHTNRVQLVHQGVVVGEVRFEPNGLTCAPQHRVRAFVELADGVQVKFPKAKA